MSLVSFFLRFSLTPAKKSEIKILSVFDLLFLTASGYHDEFCYDHLVESLTLPALSILSCAVFISSFGS